MSAAAATDALGSVLIVADRRRAGAAARALRATGFTVNADPAAAASPDLIVLCSIAPAGPRLAELKDTVAANPCVPVVVTMPTAATGSQLRQAIREGASGIVLDDQIADTLPATALAVAAGQLAVPTSVARRLAPRALSHREKEVMGLVARGYTNGQIAGELFLAESTVKTHLSSALRKLDVRSRAEASALVLDPQEGHGLAILSLADDQQKISASPTVD